MALDLGLTTHQLLSAMDGVVDNAQTRAQRLDNAIDRGLAIPADEAAFRTAAVGRRPYISARTGPEGLLDGIGRRRTFPPDWTALSVDGSHIDVDRHLPLRCHLINLGGCAITYGQNQLRLPAVQRTHPGRGRTRTCTPPCPRRRTRRDPDLRPPARRAAHGAGGGAPGRRRGEPAR